MTCHLEEEISLISVLPANHFPGAQQQPLDYPGLRPTYSFVYYQNNIYKILSKGKSLNDLHVTRPSGDVSLDEFLSECGDDSLAERHAVLAVGSNGCPGRLAEKYLDTPGTAVPVLLGSIGGVSVVYSRKLVSYGALPATFIRQSNVSSVLSVTLLSEKQLARMDETEQVGEMYERIPVESPFIVKKDLRIEEVTAYLDSTILSYQGKPIYLKAFAPGGVDGLVMDEREVLSFVCNQAGVLMGESIELRHQQLVRNESLRQILTRFLETQMADLRVDRTGKLCGAH